MIRYRTVWQMHGFGIPKRIPILAFYPQPELPEPPKPPVAPEFKQYLRRGTAELRPYVPGEDLSGVFVSQLDSPQAGGMIARNPLDHNDRRYVSKEYFDEHYRESFEEN